MRVNELEQESKEAQDAGIESASLAEFLRERQLIPADDSYSLERGRERVEKSGLLPMMQETCAAINRLMGRSIIDVHTFLPPEPTLCCFIFVEGGTEYLMRLEMRGATPLPVFVERNCRDTVTNDFVRWAHRLAEIEPVTISVRLVHELQDLHVSSEQVRKWFMYLISGMERSHAPSFHQPTS
jgi:hypothetical protein